MHYSLNKIGNILHLKNKSSYLCHITHLRTYYTFNVIAFISEMGNFDEGGGHKKKHYSSRGTTVAHGSAYPHHIYTYTQGRPAASCPSLV